MAASNEPSIYGSTIVWNVSFICTAIDRNSIASPRKPGVSTIRSFKSNSWIMTSMTLVFIYCRNGIKIPGSKQRRNSFNPVSIAFTKRANGGNVNRCLGGACGSSHGVRLDDKSSNWFLLSVSFSNVVVVVDNGPAMPASRQISKV